MGDNMTEPLIKNNNLQMRVYEVLNNSGKHTVSICYMLDKADARIRINGIEYGDDRHKHAITAAEIESNGPYDFEEQQEEQQREYPDWSQKNKLMSLANASSCIYCPFAWHESTVVPNAVHPMYLKWAYRIYDGSIELDNNYKTHEIQQKVYGDVAEEKQLPEFVQCVCSRCNNEWIVFEKQIGDYKKQIFDQLVAIGVKGAPVEKAVDENMAYWLFDVWYLDDDGVLTFHARRSSFNSYKPISYPDYRMVTEKPKEDRYKPGTAEGK